MMGVIEYLLDNGDLKILLLVACFIGWRGLCQISNAITGIRSDLKEMRSKEECDQLHGHSCKRLDVLEKKVDRNTGDIGYLRGKIDD